jgi:hypothetical protein
MLTGADVRAGSEGRMINLEAGEGRKESLLDPTLQVGSSYPSRNSELLHECTPLHEECASHR